MITTSIPILLADFFVLLVMVVVDCSIRVFKFLLQAVTKNNIDFLNNKPLVPLSAS